MSFFWLNPPKKTGFFGGGRGFFSEGWSKRDFVRTLRMKQRMEGCDEPRSTTFQTVVALPVDVVISGGTTSEQLDMPPRQFAPAFARPFGRSDTSPCSLYGVGGFKNDAMTNQWTSHQDSSRPPRLQRFRQRQRRRTRRDARLLCLIFFWAKRKVASDES